MIEWLLALLASAFVGYAPQPPVTPRPQAPAPVAAVAPETTTTTTVAPETWTDPTTGVEMSAELWTPTETYPSGDYWNDECIPSLRFPGFGTTQVGGLPCTP